MRTLTRSTLLCCTLAPLLALAAQQSPPSDYNKKFESWLKTPNEPPKVTPRVVKRTYTWLDATPAITTRAGVRYRDPSIAPWRFSIEASVDEARAQSIESHFGVPIEAIQFGYTTPEEKRRCQRLEQAKLAHHGMRLSETPDESMGVLDADYQWLIDGCAKQVEPIAASILRETDRVLIESDAPRGASARDKVAAIFRFIQSIPYETIPGLADGKDRCGMRTPLITLLKGGDCDSKSVLMAALIRSKKIADVVIVTLTMKDGSGHAILGVAVPAISTDQTITFAGKKFVLAEAATSDDRHDGNIAEFGEVGPEWKDFQSRPYEVIAVK